MCIIYFDDEKPWDVDRFGVYHVFSDKPIRQPADLFGDFEWWTGKESSAMEYTWVLAWWCTYLAWLTLEKSHCSWSAAYGYCSSRYSGWPRVTQMVFIKTFVVSGRKIGPFWALETQMIRKRWKNGGAGSSLRFPVETPGTDFWRFLCIPCTIGCVFNVFLRILFMHIKITKSEFKVVTDLCILQVSCPFISRDDKW